MTHNKCAQSATPWTWLQLLQRLTKKVGISHNDAQPVCNDLTAWRLNQGASIVISILINNYLTTHDVTSSYRKRGPCSRRNSRPAPALTGMNIVMFYMWLFLFGLHIVKAHRFSSPTHREYLNSWFFRQVRKERKL